MSIAFDALSDLRVVGGGHFGDVYSARWKRTVVAVKAARHGAAHDFDTALSREIGVLSSLRPHPHIVTVFGVCTDAPDGRVRIVMEMCAHGSLLDLLGKSPTVCRGQLPRCVCQ
jgi:serine/threonine protein kinase